MALLPFWVSAILALNHGLAGAKPIGDGPDGDLATVFFQPVAKLTEMPVSIMTHCPKPTQIVLCEGHTVMIDRPGFVNTVVTITYTVPEISTRYVEGKKERKRRSLAAVTRLKAARPLPVNLWR